MIATFYGWLPIQPGSSMGGLTIITSDVNGSLPSIKTSLQLPTLSKKHFRSLVLELNNPNGLLP